HPSEGRGLPAVLAHSPEIPRRGPARRHHDLGQAHRSAHPHRDRGDGSAIGRAVTLARVAAALVVIGALCGAGTSGGADATATIGTDRIPVAIARPDGPGRFAAVVIVHDCSGLGPRSSGAPGRWAAELVKRGYVIAMPDSFTPRGHPGGV